MTTTPTADMVRRATAEVGALLDAGHPLRLITIEMATEVARLNALLTEAEQRAEESALRSIEARNPGIDIEEVRRQRASRNDPKATQ